MHLLYSPATEVAKTEEPTAPAVAEASTPAPVEEPPAVPAEESKEVKPETAETSAEPKEEVPSIGNFLPSFFQLKSSAASLQLPFLI